MTSFFIRISLGTLAGIGVRAIFDEAPHDLKFFIAFMGGAIVAHFLIFMRERAS